MNAELKQTYKKKKKKRLLSIRFASLDKEELVATIHEISVKLKSVFRNHIGKEQSISQRDLFEKVYNVDLEYYDSSKIYWIAFWWDILKRTIRELRRTEECFIVCNHTRYYVLETEQELKEFKQMVDKDIKALNETKLKAERWVKNRKFNDF